MVNQVIVKEMIRMPLKFKSIPLMYSKERIGLKNNTLRKIDVTDGRICKLIYAMNGEAVNFDGLIEIENSVSKESFVRQITDITEWEGMLIITWKHPKLSPTTLEAENNKERVQKYD